MNYAGYGIQILQGMGVTLEVAVAALFLGLILGFIGALSAVAQFFWLRYPVTLFFALIRSLPEILVLFFIYFGAAQILSLLMSRYIDISPFVSGVVALGLIFGAYATEVIRGAFLAIDKGQIEAAEALGFSRLQIITQIQIPQAWRHAIPGLGNLWLTLLKDTAIVTLIGLADLMNQAKLVASTTQQPFTVYLFAAMLYLLITSVSQYVIAAWQKKVSLPVSHD